MPFVGFGVYYRWARQRVFYYMEKLTWFKFVISDWMMGKIQKCPEVTQARFMRLCCLYWNKECELSLEDAEIEIDEEHLTILLSKKVVKKADDYLVIYFLDEQWSDVNSLSEKRREAVKARWDKKNNSNTNVLISDTIVLQSDTDKSRVDKNRKEEIRIEDINKGVKVSATPTKEDKFVLIAKKSFETNNCSYGVEFKKQWFILIQTKKWRKKEQSAINSSLKLLMKYDEEFALALVEKSISGDYQGVVFSDTDNHYQKYLKSKNGTGTQSNDDKAQSRDRLKNLAIAVLTNQVTEMRS